MVEILIIFKEVNGQLITTTAGDAVEPFTKIEHDIVYKLMDNLQTFFKQQAGELLNQTRIIYDKPPTC